VADTDGWGDHTAVQAAQNAVYTEKRAGGNSVKDRLKVKTEESAESEQEALDAVGAGSASLTRRCSRVGPGPELSEMRVMIPVRIMHACMPTLTSRVSCHRTALTQGSHFMPQICPARQVLLRRP